LFFCLGGGGKHVGEERNDQKRDDNGVGGEGNRLGPTKVFILGPDLFYLDRLNPRGHHRPGGREKFLQLPHEAAEIAAPIHFQALIYGTFASLGRRQKKFQIFTEAGTEGIPGEGNVFALDDLDRALEKELLEVGPEIIRHQVSRSAEIRQSAPRDRNHFLGPGAPWIAQFFWQKIDKTRHRCPLN